MQLLCDELDSEPSQPQLFSSCGLFDLPSLPLVRHFLRRFPPKFCEYNIVNLFAWAQIYDYSWYDYKGRFLVYDGKNNILMMPMGVPMTPEELYTLSHELMGLGLSANIGLVSQAYLDENPEIFSFYEVEKDRDSAEYLYETQELIHLNSVKLHKKKNLVSQFHRRYPDHRVMVMDSQIQRKALGFVRDQLEAREELPESLEEEFEAIQKAFSLWGELGLGGLALMVGENIAAFSVFSRLNPDTFNVHFEKTNIAFKGAAQVINQETAMFLGKHCTYINREQDLGVQGLRQAKLSYEPCRLLVPHILKLKPNA